MLEILDLPYWDEKDEQGKYIFRDLLISSIWNSNVDQIKSILSLPYWAEKDEQGKYIFRDLLTSNIWNSNVDQIQSILRLPYWGNPIYQHLLTSSLWILNAKHIQDVIEFCETIGIEQFITISLLKKSILQLKALIHYLNEQNISIIINGKLNPIFNYSSSVLKKKYHIDLKELVRIEKKENIKLCLS